MVSKIIENMKKRYYEVIRQYTRNSHQHTLMRQQWVDGIVKRVLAAKEIVHTDGIDKLTIAARMDLVNYDVITIYEKHTLVKKTKIFNKTVNKMVISLETSFETVFNAHLCTRHGTSNDMFDWIDKCKFAVANICTPVLREVCTSMNVGCSTGNVEGLSILPLHTLEPLANPLPTKDTASITVLNMSWQPDKSFKHLLIYKDMETNFVQLRPLIATDIIDEIALELMKIFCDFSPPKAIIVHTLAKHVFIGVLGRLNNVFPNEISLQASDTVKVDPLIRMRLRNWMDATKSTSWSFGCQSVQWDINNGSVMQNSPFEKFFGIKYAVTILRKRRKPRRDYYKKSKSASVKDSAVPENTQSNSSSSTNIEQNDSNQSTSSNDTQTPTNVARESVIKGNPVKIHSNSITEQNSLNTQTIGNVKDANTTDVITSTTVDLKTSTTDDVITTTSPPTEKQEENTSKDTKIHVCCTCEVVIETDVHFCCVCAKSLHMYCGASKKNSKGDMESVCFLCL